jgi:hypothetical protein
VRLVAAEPAHIPVLAASMREMDRLEVEAFGRTPERALTLGLASSIWALTALVDDVPEAMMGVAPLNMLDGIGVPWMLGSERIYDHGRDLARYGPAIIGEMRAGFESLENLVHIENHRALRFLRHFGFLVSEERETHGGREFVRFYS